jgi:hypothetical protein
MILPELVCAPTPISSEWESYRVEVLEKMGVSDPESLKYLKRAFFAGATSMSCIIIDLSDLDPEVAGEFSERIHDDLEAFGDRVKRGIE